MQIGGFRPGIFSVVCVMILSMSGQAQNRGVYPLGMTATNSGVTPAPGFTYVNQLLFYSRDHAKDAAGDTLPVTGQNYVLMDMNTLAWVSKMKFLGGANFSAVATLPFAENNLTSDIQWKDQRRRGICRLILHAIHPAVGVANGLRSARSTVFLLPPAALSQEETTTLAQAIGRTLCHQGRRFI